mmetsp:Transcript_17603/g.56287  ORF Transcript_17603/g.56287 Transcript_17603/m.56287 type:complete len:481 (-) Transcript_17603:153-1595(-)
MALRATMAMFVTLGGAGAIAHQLLRPPMMLSVPATQMLMRADSRRYPMRAVSRHLPMRADRRRLLMRTGTAPLVTLDDDRVCTVCVALLGQFSKVEEMLEESGTTSKALDFKGFSELVDQLEVQCSEPDRQAIFAMIDRDDSRTIDASELKDALRSSGAITRMYDDSLRTFGLLLAATLAFDGGVWLAKGGAAAFDFLTAYVVEDSLSVDNLFVFLLIFRYFKVPPGSVDKCLNYGIAGSILLRGVFIFAGLAATSAFTPLLLGFSAFLLFSSYQLLSGADDDDDAAELPGVVIELLERLPLTGTFEGDRLTVPNEAGAGVLFTQLTATLVSIALCDVIFAVDSIPAVLAVSDDPFVVYSSNIAAVVGLRSLYQLLSVAVSDLVYLEKAVALVLGFVGLKLGLEVAGVELSSALSLTVILSTLFGGVVLSQQADVDEKEAYSPHAPQAVGLALASAFVRLRNAAAALKRLARTNKGSDGE